MKNTSHGGNIYKKAKELGLAQSEILDFSANISPLGLPDHIRDAMKEALDDTIHYPDPDCTALREAIAAQDGVDINCITCGNGGADLLYRLAFGLRPGKVLLPVPAFVEYEEAFTAAGANIEYYRMQDDLVIRDDFCDQIREDTDLLVICNPNNPTGILTSRKLILKILDRALSCDCMVMMDECFLEICREEEKYTLKPYIDQYPNLTILKSFTKLYAIPGVRLGYLISGNAQVIEKVNHAGQAWPVSNIAQAAGLAALARPEYKEAVIDVVEEELQYMKNKLQQFPIELCDGKANYLFFRTPGMTDLDKRLERRGILIRNCSNYENLGADCWRTAVRAHEENERLIEELECIFSQQNPSLKEQE